MKTVLNELDTIKANRMWAGGRTGSKRGSLSETLVSLRNMRPNNELTEELIEAIQDVVQELNRAIYIDEIEAWAELDDDELNKDVVEDIKDRIKLMQKIEKAL